MCRYGALETLSLTGEYAYRYTVHQVQIDKNNLYRINSKKGQRHSLR
jgi:hypothetical protein